MKVQTSSLTISFTIVNGKTRTQTSFLTSKFGSFSNCLMLAYKVSPTQAIDKTEMNLLLIVVKEYTTLTEPWQSLGGGKARLDFIGNWKFGLKQGNVVRIE